MRVFCWIDKDVLLLALPRFASSAHENALFRRTFRGISLPCGPPSFLRGAFFHLERVGMAVIAFVCFVDITAEHHLALGTIGKLKLFPGPTANAGTDRAIVTATTTTRTISLFIDASPSDLWSIIAPASRAIHCSFQSRGCTLYFQATKRLVEKGRCQESEKRIAVESRKYEIIGTLLHYRGRSKSDKKALMHA